MKKRFFMCVILVLCFVFVSCAKQSQQEKGNSQEQNTAKSDEVLNATFKPSEPETTTLQPTYGQKATIGFVGDIMIMESQVRHAKTDVGYDFTASFNPMKELFESVDLMCANLETPLAGEDAVYSEPAPTVPPATEDNPNPKKPYQTFNAPNELAYNLKDLGVDVLTTANNHCLDRGINGLVRTVEVIEKAGLYQTGTYKSSADRERLLIIDVNGIKVGIVAFSAAFNENDKLISTAEPYLSRFYDESFVKSKIEATRAAGAEYIIAVTHCGIEFSHIPEDNHVKMFKQIIGYGADAIMSSHPHVVQPIEFIDVTRSDGTGITAPIVYSLGNFISNMYPSPKNYGLFVSVEIERTKNGVITNSLSYTPVICLRQSTSIGTLHQTIPCYFDTSKISAYEKLSQEDLASCKECREYVKNICGSKYLNKD